MFRNNLQIAFRNLVRHRDYSIINIAGLSIGIAACLLLFLVVRYELSYDKDQPNYNRIHRVVTQVKYPDGIIYSPGVSQPALEALRLEMPSVEFAGMYALYSSQVTVGTGAEAVFTDKKFIEPSGMFFCEPQLFKLFNRHWLTGNVAVLKEPNTAVLSKSMAEKYFDDWKKATGQFIRLDNFVTLKVAGVLDDSPANSDFPLKVLVSFETLKNNGEAYNYQPDDWGNTSSSFQVYALLPDAVKPSTVNQQLIRLSREHYKFGTAESALKSLSIQPLSDLHFDNRFSTFGDHITVKYTLWTLSLIGVFIILMACINFINLSTAQAVLRSKEIGIRKVLGSGRRQLFFQVMGETGLLVLGAGLLAVLVAYFCLPYIRHIAFIPGTLSLFNGPTLLFVLLVLVAATLLSGLYPSMVLSGFKPVLALKNKMTSAKIGGISLRRALVVVQFAISQILIIGTIVAITQMNFVRNADIGFNKEAVLLLSISNVDSTTLSKQLAFKQSLLQTPGVQAVSFNSDPPSSDNSWSSNFAFDHKPDEKYEVSKKFADEDYFKTFGLELVAGRTYVKTDTVREIIINETLVHKLGYKNAADVIGKEMRIGGGQWKPVVGVVKDFNTSSLKAAIGPLMIASTTNSYSRTAIKLRTSDIAKTQASIQALWNRYYPEYAYSGSFMEDDITGFYKQEQQLSLLYKIFAGLAVLISGLGLFGLVSFMAVQKTKEVGVRKVLGATVGNIVFLFSKEFTILITIACLIAIPVGYYLMNNWLQDFAYRINIGVGVFAIAIGLSLLIAWLTVGYKAVKAAVVNPVKSLRSE